MSRNSVMLPLYLVVIALGAVMMQRHPILGAVQILAGAAAFGLRLHLMLKSRHLPDS